VSSRAFALFIDWPAGQGPNNSGRRVIPLPSASKVTLSLAFDDFGEGALGADGLTTAHIRIIDNSGDVRTITTKVPRGRSTFIPIEPNEVAASVCTDPITVTDPTNPTKEVTILAPVTAFVEFDP
jgi:hypothetical protein